MILNKLIILVAVCCLSNCNKIDKTELDLAHSPVEAALFAPGIVSTSLYERDLAISPNGETIIYTLGDYKQTKRCLVQLRKVNGEWMGPKILSISGVHQDIEPFFAPDGNTLYFASDRPLDDTTTRNDYNIWYAERKGDHWTAPIALGQQINTENDEFYPSISNNGNLYFTATRTDGIGREDIFVSRKVNGEYTDASVLDSTVNTKYYEFNAFISPDENLLIFSSFGRPDDLGGGDLYYSQRGKDGNWKETKHFGETINSEKLDYCPFIDSKSSNFYFTSERMKTDTQKMKDVAELIDYSNSPENGMGNIYRIGVEHLKLDAQEISRQ